MIFRSIVILCALSACAAGSDSVAQTTPEVTPKAPEVTNPPPQKVADPQKDLKRANSLIKLGQTKNALRLLAKWEASEDAPPEILYTLGRLRAGANQLLPATALYERAIKTSPKRSWRIELAAIYDFAGKTDEAIRLYQALLSEEDDADLRRELGLTLLIAKRPTDAVVELEKSLEAKANLGTRAELALALCQSQEYTRADETLRKAHQAEDGMLYEPAALGEVLRCLGDPTAALDLVKAIKARIDPALYQRLVEALSKQAHLNQGS